MAKNCKVCNTETTRKYQNTPYWICPGCELWFQDPMPTKVWEADHEKDKEGNFAGHLMSDRDKKVNDDLANYMIQTYLVDKPNAKVLDIGSKYPYLAHCFRKRGFDSYGIDGIEIVPEYSQELGVPMIQGDFESLTPAQLYKAFGHEKFDLITLIHVFEHFYDPLKVIEVLRSIVKDDGRIFIRSPDHDVAGFERDLTPGHYTIHPYFYSQPSILEVLTQAKDKFVLEQHTAMPGSGQSNFVLKPIKEAPRIVFGMIVKNEEEHLPKCLKSIESIAHKVVIVDTGSTDKTEEVAKNTIKPEVLFSQYFGASKKDDKGDWKLWDFGKARNQFVAKIDNMLDADYLFWIDADDELLTPHVIQRASYNYEFDIFGLNISSGSPSTWVHHRMWKTRKGIHFRGKIHEYPTIHNNTGTILADAFVRHDAKATTGETSSDRNLRILLEEHKEDPKNQRVCFYLGNTYLERNDYKNAIVYYKKRIELGIHYLDEYLFAALYLARCCRHFGDHKACRQICFDCIAKVPNWSEFWMELAYSYEETGEWVRAIGAAMTAISHHPIPTTLLWREKNKYGDQPARLLSRAYEGLGERRESLEWAYEAKDLIGADDQDWDRRIFELEQKEIALVRPGAIGDVIMTLNLIPALKKANPGATIHYFTSKFIKDELGWLMHEAGVNKVHDISLFESKRNWFHKVVELIGYPLKDGYPYVPMQKHLLEYFREEMGVEASANMSLQIPAPRIPIVEGQYITIHPKAGWSQYKNWPLDRWEKVIAHLKDRGYAVYQLGAKEDPVLNGADPRYMGTSLITTFNLIAYANLHLGVDSFTNHVTNYTWSKDDKVWNTPAIILWGSTQASAAGYPNNTNISLGLHCQPCFREDPNISRMPIGICINPVGQTYEEPKHACMSGITVERVIEEIDKKL